MIKGNRISNDQKKEQSEFPLSFGVWRCAFIHAQPLLWASWLTGSLKQPESPKRCMFHLRCPRLMSTSYADIGALTVRGCLETFGSGKCSTQDHTYRTNLRSAFEISLRWTSLIAFMNPFNIQMHVYCYHAVDKKYLHILVKLWAQVVYLSSEK
jgi:hypothetical protein